MIIGSVLGAVAGYFGRGVDEVIMRIADLVFAFPTIILAMIVAASLGPEPHQRRDRAARRVVAELRPRHAVARARRARRGSTSSPAGCSARARTGRSAATCCRTSPRRCWCSPRSTSATRSCCSRGCRSSASARRRRRRNGDRWSPTASRTSAPGGSSAFPGLAIFTVVDGLQLPRRRAARRARPALGRQGPGGVGVTGLTHRGPDPGTRRPEVAEADPARHRPRGARRARSPASPANRGRARP